MTNWSHLFNLLIVLTYVVVFGSVGYLVIKKAIKDGLKKYDEENRSET